MDDTFFDPASFEMVSISAEAVKGMKIIEHAMDYAKVFVDSDLGNACLRELGAGADAGIDIVASIPEPMWAAKMMAIKIGGGRRCSSALAGRDWAVGPDCPGGSPGFWYWGAGDDDHSEAHRS